MFEISVEESFAAGHSLRNYHGKCEKIHGHNYKVRVTLEGETLNEAGLLVDFTELKRLLHSVVERLDHEYLNDVPPFDQLNPSAENMAKYLHDEIAKGVPAGTGARVASVRVWETDTSVATYRAG
ncbi:MAG: 6-carboxytetrahydropterin synthase QueD [Bryobacterales bacterium]|nr:6-carboxytetrahydropterin synthase QueD [Bryobacterales bacterium]